MVHYTGKQEPGRCNRQKSPQQRIQGSRPRRFAGNNVCAFCTHAGGAGKFFPHLKAQAKNAVVLKGLHLYKPQQAGEGEVDKELDSRLSKLREE
jgi:hypothetical protein